MDLVADFCAAENGNKWFLRVCQGLAEVFQFLVDQEAADTFARPQHAWHSEHRRVLAMTGAKCVVDIKIGQLCQLCSKFREVLRFAFVKAKVLKHDHLAVFHGIYHLLYIGPHTIGGELYVPAE